MSLDQQKEDILNRISQIDGARRGQLSRQFYKRKTADGKTVRQGPYYVWQRYVKGKKRSMRVRPDQIDRVQAELEQGKDLEELVDELWAVLERSAEREDRDSKKNDRRPMKRASAKRKRPLS